MKKLLSSLLVMTTLFVQAQSNCNWSQYYMTSECRGSEYLFTTNLQSHLCIIYKYQIYDYRTKKTTLLPSNSDGGARIMVYVKGKYDVSLNITDVCSGCDTTFTVQLEQITWPWPEMEVSMVSCRKYSFHSNNDYTHGVSCTRKIWWVIDELRNKIHLDSSNLNTFNWEFKDTGTYYVCSQWVNECVNQDTALGEWIHITCLDDNTSVKDIENNKLRFISTPDYGYMEIEWSGEPTTVVAYNILGSLMYSGNTNDKIINIQSWKPGIYTFRVGSAVKQVYIGN